MSVRPCIQFSGLILKTGLKIFFKFGQKELKRSTFNKDLDEGFAGNFWFVWYQSSFDQN